MRIVGKAMTVGSLGSEGEVDRAVRQNLHRRFDRLDGRRRSRRSCSARSGRCRARTHRLSFEPATIASGKARTGNCSICDAIVDRRPEFLSPGNAQAAAASRACSAPRRNSRRSCSTSPASRPGRFVSQDAEAPATASAMTPDIVTRKPPPDASEGGYHDKVSA